MTSLAVTSVKSVAAMTQMTALMTQMNVKRVTAMTQMSTDMRTVESLTEVTMDSMMENSTTTQEPMTPEGVAGVNDFHGKSTDLNGEKEKTTTTKMVTETTKTTKMTTKENGGKSADGFLTVEKFLALDGATGDEKGINHSASSKNKKKHYCVFAVIKKNHTIHCE